MSGLAGLQLVMHGGKCCGIKHIYGFPYDYDYDKAVKHLHPGLGKITIINNDANGWEVASDKRFYHLDAPEETTEERLDRYIEYMKEYRPNNILEVALADYRNDRTDTYRLNQVLIWESLLLSRGFKEVNRCKNSNSGNTVYVYHLNIGE